jgi:hypothetical protein
LGVPEIKNEVPSDQELAAYLDESLEGSSFSLLIHYPENQRQYHPEVAEALCYLSSFQQSSELLATFRNSLFQSLLRLNHLPRTDPFWNNTNLRPTLSKLTEFCERVLSAEPNDVLSLLTISVMTVFHTGEFQRGRWAQLNALKVPCRPKC